MNFYTALEQCITQGKKFECKNNFLGMIYDEDIIQWFDKETGRIEGVLYITKDMIEDDWTEFDSTVYMDFISACKLSEQNGAWIKRKHDKPHDSLQVREGYLYMWGMETSSYEVMYEDVVSEDWCICEDIK